MAFVGPLISLGTMSANVKRLIRQDSSNEKSSLVKNLVKPDKMVNVSVCDSAVMLIKLREETNSGWMNGSNKGRTFSDHFSCSH